MTVVIKQIYILRDKKLPGAPPFTGEKYVNDNLKRKAVTRYYRWLSSFDEFRYMWE